MKDRNYWLDNTVIDQLTDTYGSKFAAINYVSKWARYLAQEYGDSILHSSALNWIITGNRPRRFNKISSMYSYQDMMYDTALDLLNYIDDEEVSDAVFRSVMHSREENHLIYEYNNIYDDPRQARIRILTKIIWNIAHIGNMF